MKKRTVAIPLFEGGVSPRCEYSNRVLIVEIEGGEEISRRVVSLAGLNPLQKINTISREGASELICTGLSGFAMRMLEANNMRVIQTVSSNLEVVIESAKKGKVPEASAICGKGGERRRRRRGAGMGRGGCGKGRGGGPISN